mmetsp:Transcript_22603/g.62880  ORF Transcript_22603/g.62880 Transcript_22603/m.62880 type:complete len:1083 (-) Transcript_22603:59-3307(-)
MACHAEPFTLESQCLRDHGWLFGSEESLNVAQIQGNANEFSQSIGSNSVGLFGFVLFNVHTNSGTGASSSTQTEDDTRAVFHQEANTLLLGNRAIHGVNVFKVVRLGNGVLANRTPSVLFNVGAHFVHHGIALGLVHTFEIVSRVVVASVLGPVSSHNILNSDKRLGGVQVLDCQNLQPSQNGPETILFTHMVGSGSEGFLSADEGGEVASAIDFLGVHEVSEVFPACGGLEQRKVHVLCNKIDSARSGHRSGNTLEPTLRAEEGNVVCVGCNDSQRIRRTNKELLAQNHVTVTIAIGGSTKIGNGGTANINLHTLAVQSHLLHQFLSIGQIGISMASVEVVLGDGVHANVFGLSKFFDKNLLGIRAINTVHGIVHHGEVRAVQQGLDLIKVKDGLEKSDVGISGADDFDADFVTSVRGDDGGQAGLGNINRGEGFADLVCFDGGGSSVNGVSQGSRSRLTKFAVVLDAKIFVWATRVVTGGQNEGTKCLLPLWSTFANDGRHGRCGQETILANPEALHTVGNTHFNNGLNGLGVVVSSVTTHDKRSRGEICSSCLYGIKGALDKVIQVVGLGEFLHLLTKTRRSRLLSLVNFGLDRGGFERTHADRVGNVDFASHLAGWHVFGDRSSVGNLDFADKLSFVRHANRSLDGQFLTVDKRRNSTSRGRLQGAHQFVKLAVQSHDWGSSTTGGVEDRLVVDKEVSVGTKEKKIVALFDGGKSSARHNNGSSAVETFNGGTHGGFELNDLLRLVVLGVDRLLVFDHGKWDESAVSVDNLLELVKANPKVVGVKEFVLGNVLESIFIFVSAHGRFAENQLLVFVAKGQVSSLFVIGGTFAAFHHERSFLLGKVSQNLHVQTGTKVVRVGDKHVLVSILEKSIQASRSDQGGVQVTVTRRAPFVGRVFLVGRRQKSLFVNFGHLVLEHFQTCFVSQRRVLFLQESQGVFGSGKGVHEHEFNIEPVFLAHGHNLFGGQVQEGIFAFDLQQGLGLVQTHTSSQTAIELEHDGFGKQRCVRSDVEFGGLVQFWNRGDGGFWDHTRVARGQGGEGRLECRDCRRRNAFIFHFFTACFERGHFGRFISHGVDL